MKLIKLKQKSRHLVFKAAVAVIALTSFACSLSTPSHSQDFFPKNYVKEPAGKKTNPTNEAKAPEVPGTNKQPLASVMQLKERIQGIVYVSSANKEHFDQVITKVLALQKQRKIQILFVNHIGDYRNVDPKQVQDLKNAGIIINAAPEIPKTLPATLSPAWGLMTPESRKRGAAYVIEGYLEPELFFNQASQFEIPLGMKVEKDTESEGKLSEF
jgi:hypothetical protein